MVRKTGTGAASAILCLSAALTFGWEQAGAQEFPTKPLRIVTQDAGGGNDNLARILALAMTPGLGQQVIVDNRAGGGGVIAVEAVAKAPPDGYTLLSLGNTMWVLPLMQSVPYDTLRDLAPVALTASSPAFLVVNTDLPVKNVRELIAYAKARPGGLNYGSPSSGAAGHLSAELFKSMAGVNIVRVPYKSGGPIMTDLMAGRVQISFLTAASVLANVKAGKLRALAVTSAKPSELMPNVRPMAAEGLPGYELVVAYAMFAPAKTPAPVVGRLNKELVQGLRAPGMKDRLLGMGADIFTSSPEELAAYVRADQGRLGKLIKDAGITAE